MKILEFLKKDSVYAPIILDKTINNVQDLYDNFISEYLLDREEITDCIIKWHQLLVWYVKQPNAVLLSRLYESKKDKDGNWNNRRGSLTHCECDDGCDFDYAFASNNFARLFFTMAVNGYVPDKDDFYDVMVNRKISLLSIYGTTKVERKIMCYLEKPYNKKFYTDQWYLAHIVSVNDEKYEGHDAININNVFELGDVEQWEEDFKRKIKLRNIKKSKISTNEKEVAVAHFLRFVDPINYFVVPSIKHVDYTKVDIDDGFPLGENKHVVSFMRKKQQQRYGSIFDDFLKLALADEKKFVTDSLHNLGQSKIAARIYSSTKSGYGKKTKRPVSKKVSKYSELTKTLLAKEFLTQTHTLNDLEKEILKTNTDRHGGTAWTILNKLGVTKDKKGILTSAWTIDDELKTATGQYKETLLNIKKEFEL